MSGTPPESVISIIGPGMTVVGDCQTEGTVRVEGVVEGSISAGKAVVIGKQGKVIGDVRTQDAVISGHVKGTLIAESRLELQATCQIDGEVHTRRMQLEEGAVLNGTVQMGDKRKAAGASSGTPAAGKAETSGEGKRPPATAPAGR
ncbi:MAG: polymer-forming cytoskeletal protein [Gemmatimonadota bacterium]|nr:polymer-forming cytoskeletal protein [Gemmatimonadota bacterium]MDH3423072.1 polymer-forming cytoskeletal protein [Gemmatimonadota bacterium]